MPVRRKDIPALRRAEILSATRQLFSYHSYSDITMDAIAQRAGVSKGNVYWYFASKKELFRELFQDMMRQFEEELTAVVESVMPPQEKLRLLTLTLLEMAEAHPEGMYVVGQIGLEPELRDVVKSEYTHMMREYIDIMTHLFAAAGEETPGETATVYALILDGLMAIAMMHPEVYDRDMVMAVLEERFMTFGRDANGKTAAS